MLSVIGVDSIDDLFLDVPESARLKGLVDLPKHQSEQAVETFFQRLSNKSTPAGSVPFFCGAGAYKHHIPATVDHLIQRSEFLTAYTPYQEEIQSHSRAGSASALRRRDADFGVNAQYSN